MTSKSDDDDDDDILKSKVANTFHIYTHVHLVYKIELNQCLQ